MFPCLLSVLTTFLIQCALFPTFGDGSTESGTDRQELNMDWNNTTKPCMLIDGRTAIDIAVPINSAAGTPVGSIFLTGRLDTDVTLAVTYNDQGSAKKKYLNLNVTSEHQAVLVLSEMGAKEVKINRLNNTMATLRCKVESSGHMVEYPISLSVQAKPAPFSSVSKKSMGSIGNSAPVKKNANVMAQENPTCAKLQNLFQSMERSCVRESLQYANQPAQDGTYRVTVPRQTLNTEIQAFSVVVNWNQFTLYHGLLLELGPQNLEARVAYMLDGETVSSAVTGQVPRQPSDIPNGLIQLEFIRPLTVRESQVLNITLRLENDRQPLNQPCSSCVGLNLKQYQISCNFEPESFDSNGQCLRAFFAWRTELNAKGGAGVCQDPQLDRQFLEQYRNCFVHPSIRYITSRVEGSLGEPARLVCITGGSPAPSVRWLRKDTLFTNSQGNTIVFDSVSNSDTGKYVCVAEEKEFFNRTVRANATLELQGQACERYQKEHTRLLRECATTAAVPQQGCGQILVPFWNGTVTIDQIQLTLRAEGNLPWVRPGESASLVNLNITIMQGMIKPVMEVPARRRRHDTETKTIDNHVKLDTDNPLKRIKRQELNNPQVQEEIIHQRVYRNVLAIVPNGYEVSANITIEPVDVIPGNMLLIKVAEEGPDKPTVCQLRDVGAFPEFQLRAYSLQPCDDDYDYYDDYDYEGFGPTMGPTELPIQEGNVTTCQRRYNDWLVARRAVPDGNQCVGADFVTRHYSTCFVPPEVIIGPSEAEVIVGETVTITCDATGFPSDYNYLWTVDGTVVPNQRGAVFRYDAVSGVHKVKCRVTSSGGETESEDSTVTVLPEGTMTFVSSIRITARNFSPEMTDPNSAAFQNISTEIKDWYQQAMGSVQGQVSIRVKDAKPGSVIATQNINVQDSVLQDKDLYIGISNALRTAAQSPSSLGVDPNSVTLLSASTCYGETVTVTDSSSNRVTLTFPSSAGDTHAYSTQRCANNTESAGIPRAVRRCIGSFETGVSWASPELLDCGLDLSKLAQMPVAEGNVAEVAADLQILTSIGGSLTIGNIRDASTVLGNIANTTGDENVGYSVVVSVDQIMNIEDDILYQSQVMDQAPSRIVQALEQFNDRVNLTSNRFRRIEQNIGVETYQIGAAELINSVGFASLEGSEDLEDGLVRSYSDSSFIPYDRVDASLALPGELGSVVAFLKENIPDPTDVEVRLSFIIYQSSRLFQSNQTAPSSADTKTRVNSRVIASRVTGFELKNLPNPVVTRYLPIVENSTNSTVNNIRCVSWDFNAGEGGAWSTEGCNFVGIDNDRVVCECNHLTNFAVLMDIYGGLHSFALDLISKIGIALSITGLVLTLITYLVFKQLRQTRPQHLLINLCVALLATLIIFLAGINATNSPVGCTVVAFLLHYFLLAVFMWMAIEAFNMYLAFVKVLGAHVSKFLLKAAILAWGLPFVIAIITLVVDVPSTYPDGQETYRSTSFCWLQGNQLYFGFLLPAGLVLLFNTIAYIMVISKLTCRGRTKGRVADPGKGATKQQLRIAIAVMVLVGLTWIFGFFMISDGRIVFSYLFCIFNSLQGFFIFIFQCVRQKEVQNLWFKCCGCPADMYRTTKSSGGKSSSNQTESTAEGYSRGHRKSSAPETVPSAYTNIPMNSI
ncbi:uncharacterized protein [Branchiostoma lanceolatum]|uniref:uncharacterized protein isoform X2 n=1 Tax=Branchiostoma lanceolatum TaxID=7740 RepID=UPI0034526BF6